MNKKIIDLDYFIAVMVMILIFFYTGMALYGFDESHNLKMQEWQNKKRACSILTEIEQMQDPYCKDLFITTK